MPSKSPAQARLMAAVAHDPKFAAEVGIPVSVGQEFNRADQARGTRISTTERSRRQRRGRR